MAISNHERVGRALDGLKAGLGPFVQREVQKARDAKRMDASDLARFGEEAYVGGRPVSDWDVSALLKIMSERWHLLFRPMLGHTERRLVSELREYRNLWAHQEPFSADDAYRAVDSVSRLLAAISAPQAAAVERLKVELMRVLFDRYARPDHGVGHTGHVHHAHHEDHVNHAHAVGPAGGVAADGRGLPMAPGLADGPDARSFVLFGERRCCTSNQDLLFAIFQELAKRDPHFCEKCACQVGDLRRRPEDFSPSARPDVRELPGGWWLNVRGSAVRQRDRILKACAAAGLRYGRDLTATLRGKKGAIT